jgi:uncharacterized repeat protein (TIGR03803 family)
MHTANHLPVGKLGSSEALCMVFVFCVAMATASPCQTLTTLYSFCSQPNCADGAGPSGGVVQATDGNFYGTTGSDGSHGGGTVFKITPSGSLTTLYNFCSQPNCADGTNPQVALVQGTDGNFYGTTPSGGADLGGTVFKITPSGTLTTLHSFCSPPNCTSGTDSQAALVQGTDGNFYGTTADGGANNNNDCGEGCGTLFKITPGGNFTTVYNFCSQPNCADGNEPAEFVQGTDGNFYGAAREGGNAPYCSALDGCGTVFKITPSGSLTTLYTFCSQPSCADGFLPVAVVQGADGNFYGTTIGGGATDSGTVFKITPSGMLTTLYSFCSQPNCTDGSQPYAGLVQAADGNFYGAARFGGSYGIDDYCGPGCGTVFKITPNGSLTTLHWFAGPDGENPSAGMVQGIDGNFYGTAGGGSNGAGIVFRLSPTSPEQFIPIVPCRLVDTRQSGNPIQGGTSQSFTVPQLGGCGIPASAAAYSLNVTVVPITTLGYLTIWPTGDPQPYVSTMNSPDGRTKANAAIVPAGANGAVSVYVTDTTNVILDIDGYFAPPASGTYQFYSLTPCRLVDTRGTDGDLGGPRLQAQTPRSFPVLQSSCIPTGLNPLAYSLNFTVVPNPSGQPLGYLSVWPTGESQPVVSTLNNPTATVVANAAIVPAGANGAIDVYAYNTTDLLIDIDGYFAAAGTGGLSMYPVAPCRVLDTRQNNGQPFSGELTVNVVGSACAPPSNAAAYVFNATVVPPGSMPYLTLWPDGEQQPVVSTLNAYDGFVTSNMAIVPTNNGSIDAYAYALTQLILDISGYFAP